MSMVPERGTSAQAAESGLRVVAFYLPQYHPIPENDEWWGKGFTEWTNVAKARPNFVGHHQPQLPADLGFYDLRLDSVREAQANLAAAHGVTGFCYHYYWFNGRKLLDFPLKRLLETGQPAFPFCLCWANENWTRRWDGQEHDILIAQRYSTESHVSFIDDVSPALNDQRYICIDGRPVLIVYRIDAIPDVAKMTDTWRSRYRDRFGKELFLIAAQTRDLRKDPRPIGFDGAVEFPPHNTSLVSVYHQQRMRNPAFRGAVRSYPALAAEYMARQIPAENWLFRTAVPSWDNTARVQNGGNIFVGSTPELYQEWLAHISRQALERAVPDERLVFINAWNEWAEGCHLEPDRRYGDQYLRATRFAIDQAVAASR